MTGIKCYNFIEFILFYFYFFYFNFLAALGLRCCAQAFSSCGERGLLFISMCGLLVVVASLVAEHQLYGAWASAVVALRLSSYGSPAQQLWHTGLIAQRHEGSSWTRDRTCVP